MILREIKDFGVVDLFSSQSKAVLKVAGLQQNTGLKD